MLKKKTCGVIVMRAKPQMSFLLMQHPKRYDLPKGNMEAGEGDWECALRELYEETGIALSDLNLDREFRFTDTYYTRSKRLGGKKLEKTVVIFLGWLKHEVTIKLSEHIGYTWMEWKPPHKIQKKTIDPLLQQLERYFQEDMCRIMKSGQPCPFDS